MTSPLKNYKPYSSGYDKDGRYYETWIEDDDDDYDFHDEKPFISDENNNYARVKADDN